ncbi:glycosyltransferase family 15 protein [Rhodotorula graminis WP1]|uniref:Glycosyltransferase family 15 protein n=1 Tax=Rhodotorula graminis (strain WP1) TaxID=578459 RepID=A0A0P9H0H5_RHOGW|nr:glycosyltransferase family 15 protein [Rhodotorula graminis WP1]KPV73334.1 glycosyltransferase family 15 protein [Rhodotorula graminis WP1]
MASSRHPYLYPTTPFSTFEDNDDDHHLAQQLLPTHPRDTPARWADHPSSTRSSTNGAGAGWRQWQGRQSRGTPAFALAALALVLVLFGGASTQPDVRDYVKDRVAIYAGGQSSPRANATIVILVNPFSNMYHALLPTLENIELSSTAASGTPIQLLTTASSPVVTPEQGWGPPEWLPQADIDEGLRKIPFPLGYRNMCRFFSMFHHKHPALEGYDWIFRLDEGITFHCELHEDPFQTLIANNKTYGFTNVDQEAQFVIPTLWQTATAFMRQAPSHYFPAGRDESFVSDDGGKTYNHRVYYNNFEIVHRSFLESEPYQAFVNYLDRAGGFYKERWGDAPIRTIAASYLLDAAQIHSFANVTGYRHDLPPFECPDLPWCTCNPELSRMNAHGQW